MTPAATEQRTPTPTQMLALKLAPSECAALLHSLATWDPSRRARRANPTVDQFAPEAAARVAQMYRELLHDGTVLAISSSEFDRDLLTHIVETTSWIAVHADRSYQKQAAIFGAMQSMALKIEQAFGLRQPLRVPLQ